MVFNYATNGYECSPFSRMYFKEISCMDSIGAQNGQEFMAMLEQGIFACLSKPKRRGSNSVTHSQKDPPSVKEPDASTQAGSNSSKGNRNDA